MVRRLIGNCLLCDSQRAVSKPIQLAPEYFSFYFPMQKVIMTDYQGITSSQKQISNRRFENVGKEELKKGR